MSDPPRHPFVTVRLRPDIETRVLLHMSDELQARIAPGGLLVLSGILRGERDELLAAYAPMPLEECLEEGQWCACILRSAES